MAEEPSLEQQTIALGKVLKLVADREPEGTPTQSASQAFKSWLNAAGPGSRDPRYFADIAENYDIAANSNEDLFKVFNLLHPYMEEPAEDDRDQGGGGQGTFVGLPVVR